MTPNHPGTLSSIMPASDTWGRADHFGIHLAPSSPVNDYVSKAYISRAKDLLRQKPSRLEVLGQFLGQRVANTSTHGDPRIGFLKF